MRSKESRNKIWCSFWNNSSYFTILKSQIRKFWGSFRYHKYANFLGMPIRKLKIRKFLWLFRKSQNRKFLQNSAQLCLNTGPKSRLFTGSLITYVQILVWAVYAKFVQGSAIRKSAKCHICGRSAYLTNCKGRKFAGFLFAELICGPPTFGFSKKRAETLYSIFSLTRMDKN